MYKLKQFFPQSLKNIYHLAKAIAANVVFVFPSRKVKVIGVTGTDGKTTTVQMITKIFEEAGKKVAMASTINFRIDREEEKNLSHFTTESSFSLQKFIKKAVEKKCEYLILETSSHALDQHRIWGVKYRAAVVTNVTREHLDYHKTIENYRKTKEKLFEIVKSSRGTIVVNLDMEKPESFLKFASDKTFAFTISDKSINFPQVKVVKAQEIEIGINDSKFKIENTIFKLNLPGIFNVENALGAICVALGEGIELETSKRALEKIQGVPGRMEAIENKRGLNIFVDFALTPNALKRLYSNLFQAKKPESRIIAVFGSCGERDKGKRPIMGEVVSQYADFVVLTNDEPYHEDPIEIIEQIENGIKNKKKDENLFVIPDRREAIRKALEISSSGDIVVVTGMGNFESMVVGDKKVPWNDRKVIEEELGKLA